MATTRCTATPWAGMRSKPLHGEEVDRLLAKDVVGIAPAATLEGLEADKDRRRTGLTAVAGEIVFQDLEPELDMLGMRHFFEGDGGACAKKGQSDLCRQLFKGIGLVTESLAETRVEPLEMATPVESIVVNGRREVFGMLLCSLLRGKALPCTRRLPAALRKRAICNMVVSPPAKTQEKR